MVEKHSKKSQTLSMTTSDIIALAVANGYQYCYEPRRRSKQYWLKELMTVLRRDNDEGFDVVED